MPTHLLFSAAEPELDRRVHRPLARERAHDAQPARDRDVGGAEPLPPRRAAARPAAASRGRGRRERVALLPVGRRVQPAPAGRSPTRRCRARRAGTSCRPASSSSGRRGRRACSTSTTACWSATTPRAAIARRSPRPRPTCSRGRRCCARCRRTSPTTACRAAGIQPSGVIELLTLSPVLPRSIRFSVAAVDARAAPHHGGGAELQRLRADARSRVREQRPPRDRSAARRARLPAAERPRSTRGCTDRCSRCSAAATGSASTSRTSSSPTSR